MCFGKGATYGESNLRTRPINFGQVLRKPDRFRPGDLATLRYFINEIPAYYGRKFFYRSYTDFYDDYDSL